MGSKIYLAAPFFSPEQLKLVERIEELILSQESKGRGYTMFSPRLGDNALVMNDMISARKEWDTDPITLTEKLEPPPYPSEALRLKVFNDNWMNIDDADIVVAVIDDFDSGVMWECGYAYARHVPILTYTNRNYGSNLMLAHSIIGHVKSLDELEDVLTIGYPHLSIDKSMEEYGAAVAQIQTKYRTMTALREGPNERD